VEDSKSNADVGALVSRLELLEGTVQELTKTAKQQAQIIHDLTAGHGGAPSTGGGLTKADLAKMSPDEINARWEEIQKLMKGAK
jgi:hypothetical protein